MELFVLFFVISLISFLIGCMYGKFKGAKDGIDYCFEQLSKERISEHEALQRIKSYIENNKKSLRNDEFQKGFMFLGDYILQIIEDTNKKTEVVEE